MKTTTIFLVSFFIILIITFSYSSVKSSIDDILLNTMDYSEGQGKSGKIPSFSVSQKYTITYLGAYFGDISGKSYPSVKCWLQDASGKKVGGGELVSESGLNVASAIYSLTGSFTLEPGTYSVFTDSRALWKINADGYYQVLIKGNAN